MKDNIVIFILLFCMHFSLLKAQDASTLDIEFYPAQGESKDVAIIMLGGSDGGFPRYDFEFYTKAGYSCIGVAYLGTQNTPKLLKMIPLEYFEKVLKHLKTLPEYSRKKIVICGGSKGAELALLLASKYREIIGVIARAPSSVVFQSIGGGNQSSWSYKGESIPFVPYADYDYSKIKNNEYVELYKLSIENEMAVAKAIIRVENINGPILLFSGKDDTVWPSTLMSEMIIQRLKDKKFKYDYNHFAYDNTGHSIDGNENARLDYEKKVINFLEKIANQ